MPNRVVRSAKGKTYECPKLLEKDIQRQILDWLKLKRIFFYRNNAGAMKGSYKGNNWFVRFGVAGMPDIVAVIDGQFIGIEVKREGEEQSRAQVEFQMELEKAGGRYWLVKSCEQLIEKLKTF